MIKNITKLLVLGLFCVSFMQSGENDLGSRYTFYTPDNKVLGSLSKEVVYNLSEVLGKNENFKDKSSFVVDIEKEDSEYSYLPPQAWDLMLQYLKGYEEDSAGAIIDSLQKMKSSEYALYLLRFSWMYKFKELQKTLAPSLLKGWTQLSDKTSLEGFVGNYLEESKQEFREFLSLDDKKFCCLLSDNREYVKDNIIPHGHCYCKSSVALHKNFVVSGSLGNNVMLYNIDTDKLKSIMTHDKSVSRVALNDSSVVSGSSDGKVKLYNMATDEVKDIISHKGHIYSLALNDKFVVSGSQDKTVKLYDIATGELKDIITHNKLVISVALNDNFVVSGSSDGKVKLYNIATGKVKDIITYKRSEVYNVAINNNFVVSAPLDRQVELYNIATGKVNDMIYHDKRVRSVALNDNFVVLGTADGKVTLYDIRARHEVKNIMTHNFSVKSLALYNNFVAAGFRDGTVKLYNIDTGQIEAAFHRSSSLNNVALNDKFLAVGSNKAVALVKFTEFMNDREYFKVLEKIAHHF